MLIFKQHIPHTAECIQVVQRRLSVKQSLARLRKFESCRSDTLINYQIEYMNNRIKLTDQQIKYLLFRQQSGIVHPYTCPQEPDLNEDDYDSYEEYLEALDNQDVECDDRTLIPTNDCWICTCGRYQQLYADEVDRMVKYAKSIIVNTSSYGESMKARLDNLIAEIFGVGYVPKDEQ